MRVQIKRMTTKIAAALFLAAAIMSVGTKEARADEIDTQPTECVETVVEGQGDVIDDQFAVVEGQGDVIDDQFAVVEGQGDVIDDQFAVVEGQGDVIDDQFAVVEGQGDIIDDCFAVAPEEAQPATETVVEAPAEAEEVEGQGDVIDDEFAVSEEEAWEAANEIRTAEMAKFFGEFGTVEMDLHDAEWYQEYQKAQEAKAAEEARLAEAAVEAAEVAENDTEVAATSVKSFVAVGSADEAQKAEETKKPEDSVVVVFDPFNPIIPFKGVPTSNESDNKSGVVETVETVNKFINPSDSVYGEPVRKVIDKCDVLGKDEKDYLKTCATLAIGSAEGFATGDYLPLWGAVKKVGKVSESLAKLHDSKTTNEVVANTIDVVTNTVEGAICAVPGGGLVLNAYKSQMALGSYCFKKVCKFVDWLF